MITVYRGTGADFSFIQLADFPAVINPGTRSDVLCQNAERVHIAQVAVPWDMPADAAFRRGMRNFLFMAFLVKQRHALWKVANGLGDGLFLPAPVLRQQLLVKTAQLYAMYFSKDLFSAAEWSGAHRYPDYAKYLFAVQIISLIILVVTSRAKKRNGMSK